MPETLPNADEFFGSAGKLPTADEFFGKPYRTLPMQGNAPGVGYVGEIPTSSEAIDQYLAANSTGHVLSAFGQGVKEGWGAGDLGMSPQTEEYLRKAGIFNDYQKGHFSIAKAFNEAWMRPAATALDLFLRSGTAAFRGVEGAVAQTGEELGAPGLGREAAGIIEYVGTRGELPGGALPKPPVDLAKARSLGVIGEGEAGWKGTAEPNAEARFAAEAEAMKAQAEAAAKEHEATGTTGIEPQAQTVAAPDIHAVARQIAPETFTKFDELAQRKDVFRRWIDELKETRDQQVAKDAPHAEEIADLQAKMEDATPRLRKKYEARLEEMQEAHDAYIEEHTSTDSPDMARIRQKLMETDFAMRDLAPDVGKAYRDAQAQMPQAEPAEAPKAAETAPAESPQPIPEPAVSQKENPNVSPERTGASIRVERTDGGFVGDWSVPKANDRFGTEGKIAAVKVPEAATKSSGSFHAAMPEGSAGKFILRRSGNGNSGTLTESGVWLDNPSKPKLFDSADDAEAAARDALGINKTQESPRVVEPTSPEAPKSVKSGTSFDDVTHISRDVSQKLVAAGRPQEEADAAGKLVASHYWARAERFNGAKGTGLDLYKAEAPEIKAGRAKARNTEYAQRRTGKISIADQSRNTITLFKDADASTFIHETGHQWLEELMGDAKDSAAPDDLVKDAQTVRDWLGVKDGEEIPRKAHEKFARGFETYMMEGRAPSSTLAKVFEQFRQWLTDIYQTVAKLRAPINDDIRDVFDRLVTAKPERAVIAPEREVGKGFADLHETDAETTPPPEAAHAADRVRQEADRIVRKRDPEVADELNGPASETGRNAGENAEAASDGNAPGPVAGEAGPVAQSGAVGEGGNETANAGLGVREESGATNGQPGPNAESAKAPTEPNERFAERNPELIDKAGNIRLDNLNTPDDINAILKQTAEDNGGFMDQRGIVSDAQVLDLADAAGVEATQIDMAKFAEQFGRGGLASKVMKLRQMLVQSALAVREAMAKAATGTDADLLAYAQVKARHQMIQGTLSAVTAEAGRALRAFHEIGGLKEAQAISDFLRDATGRTLFQLRQEAQLGLALDTPSQVSKFVHDSAKPTYGDMLLEYWINGLISGPATHTTYSVGNALLAMWKAGPETAAAAAIGALHEGPRVLIGEVPAQMYGMMRGMRNGIVAAWESVKSGRTTTLPGELENMSARQLQLSPLVNPRAAIPNFTIGGVPIPVGTLARIPSRGIAAIHSFFRAMNYEREMAALAYRQASLEGLTGDALSQRIGEIEASPAPELMQQARASATDLTLMGKGGEFTTALTRLTNARFAGGQWLKFIDPFVHISSNVIEQAILRRTVIGVLSHEVRADLSGTNGPVARDMAIARMAVGTALSVGIGSLAAEGLVNGSGPSDPKERAIYTMVNGPPHGVRIGDVWYDVHRLGPLGMQLGIAADLYEVAHMIGKEDASKVSSQLMHAFSQNILDESFMRGPSDLIKALTDHERYGASYIRNFLSSFVPYSVGMFQVARGIDPYSRQARTTMDAIKAKIPWLSQTLLPRVDVFGQPIANKDVLGVGGLSAIYETKVNNDPVPQAMLRLGVFPAMPTRKIRGVELTDQQYFDFATLAGHMAKTRMDAIVRIPGFSALPETAQRDMLVRAISTSREAARSLVMMQNPDIIKQATDAKVSILQGVLPKRKH